MLISHENSFPKLIWIWNEHGFFFHLRQREPEFLITHNYLYSYLGHFIYPQGGVNWYKYGVRSELFKHFTCWVLGGGGGRMGIVFLFNCLYVWADLDVLCYFIFTLEVWIYLNQKQPNWCPEVFSRKCNFQQLWLRNAFWGVLALYILNWMEPCYFPKDRWWPVLEIPVWDCLVSQLMLLGISPFLFYFSMLWRGTFPFSSGTVIWKVKGSFCYGLSEVLATSVTWHSKEIFAMFSNARRSLYQHSSAKIVAWCFHNEMGCLEFSVCHWNTLRLLRGQCSIKSQFFHVNPDRPWFPCAKPRLILWLFLHLWNLPRTVF